MTAKPYAELAALLQRVRRRWWSLVALRAGSLGAALAGLVLALALGTQARLAPQGLGLVTLWGSAAAIVTLCLAWTLLAMRRTPDNGQLARYVEERCPELEDALVTAIREGCDDAPRPLAAAVVDDALRRTRDLDLDRVVSRRTIRAAAVRAAVATAVLAALVVLAARPASEAARLGRRYLFPEQFVLEVAPGDVRLRAGESLRIVARLSGGVPGVVPVLITTEGDRPRQTRMEPGTDGFVVPIEAVDETFRYRVAAGDARSRDYTVTVRRPPRVAQIDLRYEYPAGVGMAPRTEEDGGDIYGPAGTRVRLLIHADVPVVRGALALGDGTRVTLTPRGDLLEGELTIGDDGSYRVALAGADGMENPGDTEYFIRTLEDRPPDVRIVKPASDRKATAIEEVSIEARADDDFGIAALDLVFAVRGGTERVVPFARDGSGLTVNGRRTVYLEDLGVQPGDFVTYYARARDVSRGKRPSEARSDIFFLEITPFEEEFVASRTQGGAGSQDERTIEDLAESQKEIITATWTLDRRARDTGTQSRDNVKALAGAQAELRKRAQSAAAQMRRASDVRRRRLGRGRAGRAPEASDNAMSRAAEAMGQAQARLEAARTEGALPHEMAALNELLRAQAEVRRREVQRQQQASGGNGQNRQQQDLSSLFDRELARQQQTNYETPTGSETRQAQPEGNRDLDRVRELARRQDELNRQQQELAEKQAGGSAQSQEELRRQIERLTREQSELRRQVEDLARQVRQEQQRSDRGPGQQSPQGQQGQQRQRGQGGQGGRAQDDQGDHSGQRNSGSGGQGRGDAAASRALQEASEDMQNAANELRRHNAREASQRGGRALERLREIEQQMRSVRPDDRRRAVGEAQLEARQLADAQRRLAAAGGAAGRGADPDGARRRAVEQARLADRMQRLEESIRKTPGLGVVAGELDQQRLSERMRQSARGEQKLGTPAPGGKGGEEEIARALDRLSDRLGAVTGEGRESEQLSAQLSRIRELREQLARIDRQIGQLAKGDPGRQGEHEAQQRGRNGRAGQGQPRGGGDATPWNGTRELIAEMRRALEYRAPEANTFNPGRSAPGTEAWKQDFEAWQELKVQLAAALEQAESTAAARLRAGQAADRLTSGASQRVPEEYRRLVEQYYRALAAPERR